MGFVAAGSLALDLIRVRILRINRVFVQGLSFMLKSDEDQSVTGPTYMFVGAFLSLLLFDKTVAAVVLLFLALGDPMAALVGRSIRGPRVLGKSPVGTLAFVGASLLVVVFLVFGGVISFQWVLVLGAVVAGLAELAPLPVDDNVTVPLITGAVIQFLPQLTPLVGI